MPRSITFISDSAGNYEVHVDGHYAGWIGHERDRRVWITKAGEFELGEHRTRQEAAEAIADIDRT
jgi:hypothetical protein